MAYKNSPMTKKQKEAHKLARKQRKTARGRTWQAL